jgi:predicted transcriptional regulator
MEERIEVFHIVVDGYEGNNPVELRRLLDLIDFIHKAYSQQPYEVEEYLNINGSIVSYWCYVWKIVEVKEGEEGG